MEAVTQRFKQTLNEGKQLLYENQSAKLQFSIGAADHGNTESLAETDPLLVQEHQSAQLQFIISATDDGNKGVSAALDTNIIGEAGNTINGITDRHVVIPTKKDKTLLPIPNSSSSSSSGSSSSHHVNSPDAPPVGIVLSPKMEVQEIYLKNIYIMPPNHEFYCPKCNVCIEKVLLCRRRVEANSPDDGEVDQPECTDYPIRCSACLSFLVRKGKEWIISLVPSGPENRGPPIPRRGKGWEVVKSFVYGGLAELLASLSVVTSAASADAYTINIVALAVANLIGGLILLVHNLRELKDTQPREEEAETDATADKYYELLGKREHFYLHAFVAILSFIIFGLLPPVAYGLSFRESNDKDLKLAAVAGVSLIGITVLAIAKAYAQRSNTNFVTSFKTVFYYVTSGVLASLLTYLAGTLMKRLVEQLGWFDPIPEMTIENPGWGPY